VHHAPVIRTILVGGHESADGADLVRLETLIDGCLVARPGRQFHNQVSEALSAGETVVVVPMTFGRNPTMVADTAKTLKWLGAKHPGRLALSAPFGTIDHLTSWLRSAANAARAQDADAGIVVLARRSNPFDEAELHRVAYLVATHGAADEVFPAIVADAHGLAPVIDRLHRLGIDRAVVVPAGFAVSDDARFGEGALAGARFFGPIMSDGATVRTVRTRVADALSELANGHDGIAAGLDADHGHGYAHSHAFDEGAGHAHAHPHSHADGTTHSHDNEGLHAHVHAS
jgi:sirohydrochlorin cobaltochelatase